MFDYIAFKESPAQKNEPISMLLQNTEYFGPVINN